MKFRLKLTGAAMLLGAIVSHGADAPAFRYSGTAAERALLNNMSALMFGGNAIRRTLFVVDQAQQKTQRPYADARRVFHKLLHAFLCMECDCGRNAQRIDDGQNGESGWFSDAVFWLAAGGCLML